MKSMDKEIREQIEKEIDKGIKNLSKESSARSVTEWVLSDIVGYLNKDFRSEIKSAEELAVGYVLGYLGRLAHGIILEKKNQEKAKLILESIKDNKPLTKKYYISVSKKETEEVREILHSRLPTIREEIVKALNA
jgi:hypothetical protein